MSGLPIAGDQAPDHSALTTLSGGTGSDADRSLIQKLERILSLDNGHCGESTSERIERERFQEPIRQAAARIRELEGALKDAADALRWVYRGCEMSAGIMRDPARTGGWAGAEKTADAFDAYAERSKERHVSARSVLDPTR